MTLDDHEIADQFAPRLQAAKRRIHAEPVPAERPSVAYRDYAHALGPLREKGQPMPKCGPFWYTFDKGRARFFVLDTRTRRHMECGEIIDREQMTALLTWMVKHNDDLKFVVSSVPFVAEVNERTERRKVRLVQGQGIADGKQRRTGQTAIRGSAIGCQEFRAGQVERASIQAPA